MTIQITAATDWYVAAPVSATDPVSGPINLAGDAVSFAFVPEPKRGWEANNPPQPTASQWVVGELEGSLPQFYARILVGPTGAVALVPGRYLCWVQIADTPETPQVMFDVLEVL